VAAPTERTEVRRKPERGDYRPDVVEAILDEGFVAHVGFVAGGSPVVIPMIYARAGTTLYLHGSPASRLLRGLRRGIPVCVTVTLLDGIVLARSALHHSVNYRSVVVLGAATEVTDPDEKRSALAAVVEGVARGRSAEARPPTPRELAATLVLALPLSEASAKIRSGPPVDDAADYALPVWAGEVPLRMAAGPPVPDPRLDPTIPLPTCWTTISKLESNG
jgi:uncharacterized protein